MSGPRLGQETSRPALGVSLFLAHAMPYHHALGLRATHAPKGDDARPSNFYHLIAEPGG